MKLTKPAQAIRRQNSVADLVNRLNLGRWAAIFTNLNGVSMDIQTSQPKPFLIQRLFNAPYVPTSLIILASLIILTNSCFILFSQPSSYWLDYGQAVNKVGWVQSILVVSPFLFLSITIGYMAIIGLALWFLRRSIALVLWIVVCFLALQNALSFFECEDIGIIIFKYNFCYPISLSISIIASGVLGIALVRTMFVSNLLGTEQMLIERARRGRISWVTIILTVIWLGLLGANTIRVTQVSDKGWRPVVVQTLPKSRVDGIIAYDHNRQKAVMFGGASEWLGGNQQWLYEDDTWEWDGNKWTQMFPNIHPSGRVAHGMAYDEERKVMVLFGGRNQNGNLNDTWEWDGQQWHETCPDCNPPARDGHKMYYDPQRKKVVIYGGYGGGQTFYSDAWAWDGKKWEYISQENNPVFSNSALAYDPTAKRVVTFLSGHPSGTWIWAGSQWEKLYLTPEPPLRGATTMVYDPNKEWLLLFGGLQDQTVYGDTWIFNKDSWQAIESPQQLANRWGHSMFFDDIRGHIVVFGGFDGKNYRNDMWEFIPEN